MTLAARRLGVALSSWLCAAALVASAQPSGLHAWLGAEEMPRIGPGVKPPPRTAEDRPGTILLEVVVGTNGRAAQVRVLEGLNETTDRAAVDTVRSWQFVPGRSSRRPQTVLAGIELTYDRTGLQGPGRVEAALVSVPARQLPDVDAVDALRSDHPGLAPPRPVRTVAPNFTPTAMQGVTQGAAVMDIVIMPDGTVGAIRATQSLPNALQEQAVRAASYWLFEPARLNDQPVAVRTRVELNFGR